jgi:hypothetical protein
MNVDSYLKTKTIIEKFVQSNLEKYGSHAYSIGYLTSKISFMIEDFSEEKRKTDLSLFLDHIDKLEKDKLITILKNSID